MSTIPPFTHQANGSEGGSHGYIRQIQTQHRTQELTTRFRPINDREIMPLDRPELPEIRAAIISCTHATPSHNFQILSLFVQD